MNSNIKYFRYLIGIGMIASAIFFGISNFLKSPFSNKAIIEFFNQEITTKKSSYTRIINSMKNLKSENHIYVSFVGMNNEVSISYQPVQGSKLISNHQEKNYKRSNELEIEKIKSISGNLNLKSIGIKHFNNDFYYIFYNANANHPGHEKKVFLIYFFDEQAQNDYIKRTGIETYLNSKTKNEWIKKLDTNWLIQAQEKK